MDMYKMIRVWNPEYVTAQRQAVENGVQYMRDRFGKGWWRKIKTPLNMSNGCNCILGQSCGEFWDELDRLMPTSGAGDRQVWARDKGFSALAYTREFDPPTAPNPWDLLGDLWHEELKKAAKAQKKKYKNTVYHLA